MMSWISVQPIVIDKDKNYNLIQDLFLFAKDDELEDISQWVLECVLSRFKAIKMSGDLVLRETSFNSRNGSPFYILMSNRDSFDVIDKLIFDCSSNNKKYKNAMEYWSSKTEDDSLSIITAWMAISTDNNAKPIAPSAMWFVLKEDAVIALDLIGNEININIKD